MKKRLVKSPKIYLRDSGLLHYLLRISDYNQLPGHPIVGHSWEGYIIEQIISTLGDSCVEIKFTSAPIERNNHGLLHYELITMPFREIFRRPSR